MGGAQEGLEPPRSPYWYLKLARLPGSHLGILLQRVVPKGLEPPRVAPLVPETSASTSSATSARLLHFRRSRSAGRSRSGAHYTHGPGAVKRPPHVCACSGQGGVIVSFLHFRGFPRPMTARSRRPWHRLDPFFAREQEKYGRHCTEPQFILQTLEAARAADARTAVRRLGHPHWDGKPDRCCAASAGDDARPRNRATAAGATGRSRRWDLRGRRIISHPGAGFPGAPDEGGEDLSCRRTDTSCCTATACADVRDRHRPPRPARGLGGPVLSNAARRGWSGELRRGQRHRFRAARQPPARPHDFLVPPAGQGSARPEQIVVAS